MWVYSLENKIKVKEIITITGFNNLEFNDDMSLYKSFYFDEDLSDIKFYYLDRARFYLNNVFQSNVEGFSDIISSEKVLVNGARTF